MGPAQAAVLRAQMADSGKPPDIVDKAVAGRLKKYAAEKALRSQIHVVVEGKDTVAKVVAAASPGLEVAGFDVFGVGEAED